METAILSLITLVCILIIEEFKDQKEFFLSI